LDYPPIHTQFVLLYVARPRASNDGSARHLDALIASEGLEGAGEDEIWGDVDIRVAVDVGGDFKSRQERIACSVNADRGEQLL
jgi:hypothetical protein